MKRVLASGLLALLLPLSCQLWTEELRPFSEDSTSLCCDTFVHTQLLIRGCCAVNKNDYFST